MNDFRDWADQWVIASDPNDLLAHERRHFRAEGSHVLGFVYVDHSAGLSLRVDAFCSPQPDGSIRRGSSPREQGSMLVLRYDLFDDLGLSRLNSLHAQQLGLPPRPEWLEHYRCPAVEPLRSLSFLDPLRAPGYPDDIKFLLPGVGGRDPEIVWGRLERSLREHYFECTLLNDPNQDFGYRTGDALVVSVRTVEGGVSPVCVGRMSDLVDS
jgi:hypothetical protein